MPVKSLKNLDSFSPGYIEGRTTKVDFNTTLTGEVKNIYLDIDSVTIDDGDTNVTSATVVFSSPGGSHPDKRVATGDAVIVNGVVTGVTITDAGAKYASTPTITITTDGDNETASATVVTSTSNLAVNNETTIYFTQKLIRNEGQYNEISPQIGQVISGPEIVGIPKVISVIITPDLCTEIITDIPQTITAGTILTISDTNSGLKEYELTGSTLPRSKEDLRLDQIVPSELLNYSSDSNYDNNTTGGIKAFVNAYYKFMNTEEFLYNTIETFDDVVINNIATIRIPDPQLKNNRFFSLEAARSSQFYDDEDNLLTVGNNSTEFDINYHNIEIYNVDNLPSDIAFAQGTGRTLSIIGLPARLNNRKIKVKTSIQNYVTANPSFRLNTLEDALNINETDEKLLDMMQKEIAPAVNKNIKVDKRTLYQRLIDFYRIRGSKDSIDTFFKLFFQDEEINVVYPWDSTLKPSTGNWDSQTLIAPNYSKRPTPITASDAAADDEYGSSLSLDAITNLFVVGAPGETSDKGAVYAYRTSDSGYTYTQEEKIVRSNPTAGDKFGSVVSLSNNIVAISAPGDTAYNGGTASNSGTVEIWERVLTQAPSTFDWQYRTTLQGATAGLEFGTDISLDGNTLAVAVPGYVNSDRSNGAVLLYKAVGSSWTLSQTIPTPLALNFQNENGWAKKVVLRGDMLLVSWPEADNNKGSVSIFHINHSTGLFTETPERVLKPEELTSGALFGSSIDVDSTVITERICVVGAPGMRAAYTFKRLLGLNQEPYWNSRDKLEPSDDNTSDLFGSSVAIYLDNVLVGAPNSVGIGNTNITDSGLVYHFEEIEDQWLQKAVYSETPTINHKFGSELEISRNNRYDLLVGAPYTTSGGNVINFNRSSQEGKYLNNHGFISDKQKIQDSEFYQKFSYVIKASRNISQWKDTYNKLVHPAGFKYFGEILVVIKAVRDVLGDSTRETTIFEDSTDIFGRPDTVERIITAYKADSTFRKTLSSMPGIQPGFIGEEDLGLLIEMLISVFNPNFTAKPNRSAKLAITKIAGVNDSIPHDGISIVEAGYGYRRLSRPRIYIDGSATPNEREIDDTMDPWEISALVGTSNVLSITDRYGQVVDVIVQGGLPLETSTPTDPKVFKIESDITNTNWTASTHAISSSSYYGERTRSNNLSESVAFSASTNASAAFDVVIDASKSIQSITVTTAGNGFEFGDKVIILGSSLGGTDGVDDLVLTVNETHFGTNYTINTDISIKSLADVAESSTETAIEKIISEDILTVGTDTLSQWSFFKIIDKGNLDDDTINLTVPVFFQKEEWNNGDTVLVIAPHSELVTRLEQQGFTVPPDNTNLVTTTVQEISYYDTLKDSGVFGNKKYKLPPIVSIDAPDAIDLQGLPLDTNVNATAEVTLDNAIALDNTARLAIGQRYTITYIGNTTDVQFNSISFNKTKTNWQVGDTFIASSDGTAVGSATTGTVAIYDHAGKIISFKITNDGFGYINQPRIRIQSNSLHEKRVPDLTHTSIVTNGNEIQTIEPSGVNTEIIKTSIDRTNDYFTRKDYDQKAILGTKKFNGEFNISQFDSLTIENVGESIINKNNINTTIQTTTDRNT